MKMPIKKKKKYNSRFPPARIKKIMQTDEEVGKVAAAVPVIISRALELFVENLLSNVNSALEERQARTMTPSHLKSCIHSVPRFDFLKELVADIPDLQADSDDLKDGSSNSTATNQTKAREKVSNAEESRIPRSQPKLKRQCSNPRPRGRPRKKSSDGPRQKSSKKRFVDIDSDSDNDSESQGPSGLPIPPNKNQSQAVLTATSSGTIPQLTFTVTALDPMGGRSISLPSSGTNTVQRSLSCNGQLSTNGVGTKTQQQPLSASAVPFTLTFPTLTTSSCNEKREKSNTINDDETMEDEEDEKSDSEGNSETSSKETKNASVLNKFMAFSKPNAIEVDEDYDA